jgi:hypothetical protein
VWKGGAVVGGGGGVVKYFGLGLRCMGEGGGGEG